MTGSAPSNGSRPADLIGGPPLTARSVLLSVLLGSHPPYLPVRTLVRTAELFGIAEGTARTALSRLAADGDVQAAGGMYHLSPRLLQRQWDQDSSLRPRTRSWRGGWELAVAAPHLSGAAERSALGAELGRLRLAELRPGVWARPDNLTRDWPEGLAERALRYCAQPTFEQPGPAELVGRLWDLAGWSAESDHLIDIMAASADTAQRFVVAAAMLRHLRRDPLLPPALQPAYWAGGRLRAAYDSYRRELGRLLERERERD